MCVVTLARQLEMVHIYIISHVRDRVVVDATRGKTHLPISPLYIFLINTLARVVVVAVVREFNWKINSGKLHSLHNIYIRNCPSPHQ